MFNLTRMCSGEVAITVWTRPRLANFTASAQRSMSFGLARDRPAMTEFLERRAISLTAWKSPSEVIGKAGLDDVDAHVVEHLGDLDLFLERHGGAGALLAVAQGGVEYDDAVLLGLFGCSHWKIPFGSCAAVWALKGFLVFSRNP